MYNNHSPGRKTTIVLLSYRSSTVKKAVNVPLLVTTLSHTTHKRSYSTTGDPEPSSMLLTLASSEGETTQGLLLFTISNSHFEPLLQDDNCV